MDHGWLLAKHTFSFGSYRDPNFMGFSDLLVINQDQVVPGKGFATHPHNDMEIITYVTKGVLEHKDSMGNKAQIQQGEIQVMSAGTGITHSEYNPSSTQTLELLQIWIQPDESGHAPRYDQCLLNLHQYKNQLRLMISKKGGGGLLWVHQNVKVYASLLEQNRVLNYELTPQRKGWLQMVSGELDLNGCSVGAGDGVFIEEESQLKALALQDSEFLLFDLRGDGI